MKKKIIYLITFCLSIFTIFSCQKLSEEKTKSKKEETLKSPGIKDEKETEEKKTQKKKTDSVLHEKTEAKKMTDKLEGGKGKAAQPTTGSAIPESDKMQPLPSLKRSPQKRSRKGFIGKDQDSPVALSSSITTFSGINPNQIREFMNKKNGECLQCHKADTEDNVAKVVEITFTFKSDGKISTCKINKPLQNQQTAKCICKKAKQWQFPNLQKEISFKHKFKFKPAP